MTERLMEKLARLGAEAGIKQMTPEINRFFMLVRADVVAQWPERPVDFGPQPDMDEILVHKISEEVLECTVEDFLEHGTLSFFMPFQYSTWESASDGLGGKPVNDPLTIYMSIDVYGDDDRITFHTTLRKLLEDVYEGFEGFTDPMQHYLDSDDVGLLTRIRDALLAEVAHIDGWLQTAKSKEKNA